MMKKKNPVKLIACFFHGVLSTYNLWGAPLRCGKFLSSALFTRIFWKCRNVKYHHNSRSNTPPISKDENLHTVIHTQTGDCCPRYEKNTTAKYVGKSAVCGVYETCAAYVGHKTKNNEKSLLYFRFSIHTPFPPHVLQQHLRDTETKTVFPLLFPPDDFFRFSGIDFCSRSRYF